MAGVVLEGLSRVYPGGVVACDRIDLEARDGELLVLVGPSGSGKSTTLRLIAGLERPTAGVIRIGDRVVNDLAARRRDVAMVFQSHALYPHWTAYKNIAFGLQLRQSGGWLRRAWRRLAQPRAATQATAERRALVLATARGLGIETLLDRLPGELSGGEAQRVARLGRAIVRRPALFLFDEPLSSLDAQLRVKMRRQLKQLHQRLGATMIYVTHDQVEALALGDRVAVLAGGNVQQIGSPREVYEQPANRFVAGFMGGPPMNFFEGRRGVGDAEGAAFRLSAGGWSIDVDGRWWPANDSRDAATMGIRPEHIHVRPSDSGRPAELGPDGSAVLRLAAKVDLVEELGDSCVVSLAPEGPERQSQNQASPDFSGAVLLGKAETGSGLKPGEQVIAWFDMRRAHWFDLPSGRNLRSLALR